MFVITGLGVGGAENQLLRLTSGLQENGWEVKVVAFHGGELMTAALRANNIQVQLAPSYRFLRHVQRAIWLNRQLLMAQPSCVISFMLQANVIARVVGKIRRIPVISSIRNSRFGGSSKMGQVVGDLLERLTYRLAELTVVNSQFAADSLINRGVISRERTVVIPNGLKVPPYSAFNDVPQLSGAYDWVSIGRLVPQKNHKSLLEAMVIVLRVHPGAHLHIVGQGPLESELRSQAIQLGIINNVHFLGLQTNVMEVMRTKNGFVLSSEWEGLPNVVMEAMAVGLPVVATPVGGVPELIVDGKTGILARSATASDIAEGMLRLMNTGSTSRVAMIQQAYSKIAEEFSMNRAVDLWRGVIVGTVAQRKGAA